MRTLAIVFAIGLFTGLPVSAQMELPPSDKQLALNSRNLFFGNVEIFVDRLDSQSLEISLSELTFLTKMPLSEQLSLMAGPKIDVYRVHSTGEQHIGILGSFGFEFIPKENFHFNALMHYRVNALPENVFHYNTFNNTSFTIGSGFKF